MGKSLTIRGVSLHLQMKDEETQDEAMDRMLELLESVGIDLFVWIGEEVEED